MEYTYKLIDTNKYELYDELRKGIFEYRAKNPENILSRENHNRFFAKRALWSEDLHLGEFLGGLIGKKNGFKICDVELYRHPLFPADRGVISFVSFSKSDKLITSKSIIHAYLKSQNLDYKNRFSVDVDTVFRAMFWFMYQYKRPYDEFLKFKQEFIDMLVYDLKLLNPDRGLENWFIRQDIETKETDLYPMFDNEMILGFNTEISDKIINTFENQLKSEDTERTSAILTPNAMMKHQNNVDYKELFDFLLKKYSVQTKNSLNKFHNFSSNDLLEILNSIPDLSENRKRFAIHLFEARSIELDKMYEKHDIYKSTESEKEYYSDK